MGRRGKKQQDAVDDADAVSIVIDAPAEKLYDIVSDITKMGRLSPECTGGSWLKGAKGPAVGAEFRGRNRRGPVFWMTRNTVVAANRGREFAFETRDSGTRWGYRFEPADAGSTLVTETRSVAKRRPLLARVFSVLLLGGVADHDEEMRQGMRTSLERLKTVAETPDRPRRLGRRAKNRRR